MSLLVVEFKLIFKNREMRSRAHRLKGVGSCSFILRVEFT